ncbi:MAG: universal stress protein [Pseudomonadota bacterium]|nr:universal stress protein [Pseudomonadota bacterium]
MKILLATDGSESARAATCFLEQFPFPRGSSVTVLTVVDEEFFNPEAAGPLEEDQRQLLRDAERAVREEGERLLEAEAECLRKTGWEGSGMVRTGSPANEIVRAAEEIDADLVVIGSKGVTGISRFLLGSVSHQVMEYAPCSVLIVKPKEASGESDADAEKIWRILLAFDDSEPSRKAVDLCASLPLGEHAEVTALTVMPMVRMYRQDIRQELNPIWQQKTHAAHETLDETVKAVHWATPKVSVQLRESADASHGILEAARELDSDLILLGNKGRRAIKRFLLGSVTHHVARHAGCAVWIVRG